MKGYHFYLFILLRYDERMIVGALYLLFVYWSEKVRLSTFLIVDFRNKFLQGPRFSVDVPKEQILPKIFCCPKTTWDEKLLNTEFFRNFRTRRFILRKLELKKVSIFQNSTFLRIHSSHSYFQHFLLRTRPTDQNKACLPFLSYTVIRLK